MIAIIGGGAAGMFAAALCKEMLPETTIIVFEKTKHLLAKVRISGGGRCNVTHAAFDPKKLVTYYPRGNKELLGPFHHFQPKDTIAWFERHGVILKTEEDGRMFPITDSSHTIIECLLNATRSRGVEIRCEASIHSIKKQENVFVLTLDGEEIRCDYLILATGSSPHGHILAASLGHKITPPVPSLFTFNIPASPLLELSGISVPDVELRLKGTKLTQRGPLLLTHFGFSGPATLKLSAWAARYLHDHAYRHELLINWIPSQEVPEQKPPHIPTNLWKKLLHLAHIPENIPISRLSNAQRTALTQKLTADSYLIESKTLYKQEFVTCGGVLLKEVNFKTMESKLTPNLYFAGEILDIDGVTGGFNFQNAWTTAFLAAQAIRSQSQQRSLT